MERNYERDYTDERRHEPVVFESGDYATVSDAVVDAVSTVASIDPLDMDPLYFSIDLDALERIVGPKLNGRRRSGRVVVEFEVDEYDIAVNSDGLISVLDTRYRNE
ncbi:HalOD1 output domain-containing protein [Haladaptatus sp. CMAA 1911]|uniref:HalOD1 output domain-containing protein n=1 Tax=unclassified Haladaptatus TaxID=2622732 RepID=UPI0037551AF9